MKEACFEGKKLLTSLGKTARSPVVIHLPAILNFLTVSVIGQTLDWL